MVFRGLQRGFQRFAQGLGLGPGGFCVCPACGHKVPHQVGVPCFTVTCPSCGGIMIRKIL